MNTWSDKEHKILEKYYPTEGIAVSERLPGRSHKAITNRVSAFGIKVKPENRKPRTAPKMASRIGNVRSLDDARVRGLVPEIYGKTAGTKEGLQPVPDSMLGLPWVSHPRDPHDLEACAEILERAAHKEKCESVKRYLVTQALYLRALSKRVEIAA